MKAADTNKIFEALGRIEQKIDGHLGSFKEHTDRDDRVQKAIFERLETLQAGANRQKGALTVLGAVGSMVGAGVGYLIERYLKHG